MTVHARVGGAWKPIARVYIKVSGVWKLIATPRSRIGGVWKDLNYFLMSPASAWGSSVGLGTRTSAAPAITVPTGNPGIVRLYIDDLQNGTLTYSKGGGAYTALTHNMQLTFTNGETLSFRLAGPSGITECYVLVYDHAGDTVFGTWTASIT